VSRLFEQLGPVGLDRLAGAIEAGRVALDGSTSAVTRVVARNLAGTAARELFDLGQRGLGVAGVVVLLRTLAAERREQRALAERVELVWTDPEQPAARDTAVVVRGLCARAEHDLLLANYAFDQPHDDEARARARALWAPLADNMNANPDLRVRMFVNVGRDWKDTTSEGATLIREFIERFSKDLWPGARMPELFHDPRALLIRGQKRACMHAKCIVVDNRELLITSANFTQAAQARNIEAGLVLRDELTARRVVAQFDRLVELGRMLRLPSSH